MTCSKCGYKFKNEKATKCPNCIMTKHADHKHNYVAEGAVAAGGAATGAVLGTADSYLVPVKKQPYVHKVEKQKFLKKLRPGDVLLTGGYKADAWGKGLQSTIDRNSQEYHVSLYTGKKKGNPVYSEILIRHQEPAGTPVVNKDLFSRKKYVFRNKADDRINKDLNYALTEDSHVAYRPKYKSVKERNQVIRNVHKEITNSSYDSKAAIGVMAARRVGVKKMNCKGRFCSNVISSQMPRRFFPGMDRTMVMPFDFKNSKHFKEIGSLRARNIHLPASTKALKKYSIPAAIIGGALSAGIAHQAA